MAFDDALFQLGMDLTRSSTAQKEDFGEAVHAAAQKASVSEHRGEPLRVAQSGRKDSFIERGGIRFAGSHLIIDLVGASRLDDLAHVEETLKRCVDAAGATLLNIHLHRFTPTGGVAGVAVLAESHISFHSWPEKKYAALDVFMCGDAKPHRVIEVLSEAFQASELQIKEHRRGMDVARQDVGAQPRKRPAQRTAKTRERVAA